MKPTPTLALPLKGREMLLFLPLQGGGEEGDGDLPEQYNYVFSIMASLMTPAGINTPMEFLTGFNRRYKPASPSHSVFSLIKPALPRRSLRSRKNVK
jgi:hypothetical protein